MLGVSGQIELQIRFEISASRCRNSTGIHLSKVSASPSVSQVIPTAEKQLQGHLLYS